MTDEDLVALHEAEEAVQRPSFADLLAAMEAELTALGEARRLRTEAERAFSAASCEVDGAVARVDAAQKAMDDAIASMLDAAPRGSRWSNLSRAQRAARRGDEAAS